MVSRSVILPLCVLLLAVAGCKGLTPPEERTVVLADVPDVLTHVLSLRYPLDDRFVRQVMADREQGSPAKMSREILEEQIRRIVGMRVAAKVLERDAVYCRFGQRRLADGTWAIKRDSAEIGTFEEASGKIDVEVLGVEGHLTYRIEPEVQGKLAQRDLAQGAPPYDVGALEFWVAYRVHLGGIVRGKAVETVPYRLTAGSPAERAK